MMYTARRATMLTLFTLCLLIRVTHSSVKMHHRHDRDRNRSLYIKHTIKLLLEATSKQPDLTCWTCPTMASNGQCNNWAPDTPCSQEHSVCKSVHHVDIVTGKSVAVSKTCALPTHCTIDHVGCHATHIPNIMSCVSCCTESYCNEAVPYDSISSLRLSQLSNTAVSLHSIVITTGLTATLWSLLRL